MNALPSFLQRNEGPVLLYKAYLLTRQSGPGSAARQAAALRREGVHVDEDSMGAFSVEMGRFGWFPDVLPSEEGEDSDEDEDEVAGSSERPDSEGVEEPEA
jgi:hypothetical protein